jgi:hypothetical protein
MTAKELPRHDLVDDLRFIAAHEADPRKEEIIYEAAEALTSQPAAQVSDAMLNAAYRTFWDSKKCGRERMLETLEAALLTAAPRHGGEGVVEAALDEAMRRYPDDRAGLAWFAAASGLRAGEITQEIRDWADEALVSLGVPK